MTISFIIPLFNRPEEISELLSSFLKVRVPGSFSYEIIIVEDGSSLPSAEVIANFRKTLPITYLTQSNTGPSGARNHGAKEARGEWLVFLDSDTLLPPGYFEALLPVAADPGLGLFGGPDRGSEDFTPVQKAISYSMTSFLTTGGIRGGKSKGADRFYPRTFNMGIRKSLFEALQGFDTSMRYGEDLDLSMRAIESRARSSLVPDAWLYHKRRTDYTAFFKQVMHSGQARWVLEKKHPGTMKPVHWTPFLFSLFILFGIFTPLYIIYAFLIFLEALISYKYTGQEALHSVLASFVQHFGYGWGFLKGALGERNKLS